MAWRCLPSGSNGASSTSVSTSSPTATATTSKMVSNSSMNRTHAFHTEREVWQSTELFTRYDSYVKKVKSTMYSDGITLDSSASHGLSINSAMKTFVTAGEDSEKLSLIKLASLIEVSSKKRSLGLNLQNKLMKQVEWLPDSIGKLSSLVTLNLSDNNITALPRTMGALSSLTKLELQSNRIAELPESIGDLFSLMYLDVRGNQLMTLPSTFGKLVRLAEIDLSSNQLSSLPDTLGNLVNLKKLIVETNDLEELPHTISHCTSLVEFRADYNRFKCLPEAVGRLGSLVILSARYNNIKSLPTTMASLSKLKEIDLSFNELEAVPESLCLATTIVKMNIGKNFADLQSLPRSIRKQALSNLVPICHISESVYKTSVNWIGRYPTEALGTFVLWSLDSILDDLNRQHETFKGSKKVAQKSSTKAQIYAVSITIRIVVCSLTLVNVAYTLLVLNYSSAPLCQLCFFFRLCNIINPARPVKLKV